MSTTANVRSVEALEELKSVLARFAEEAENALQATKLEIRRTEEWLEQRLTHWRIEVQRRQEEVRLAEAALARCQATGFRDPKTGAYYIPPCTAELHALELARQRLQKAQEELNNVQHWKYYVDEAASAYSIQAAQLDRRLTSDLPSANSFLGRRIAELRSYLMATMASGGGVISSASPSTFTPRAISDASGVWVDTGIQDVDLELIDLDNSPVDVPDDFHKVSAQEMQEGLDKLKDVVIPKVSQGADGDYFSQMDTSLGLDYSQGYRRIYDAFYGQGCIRIEKIGDRYQVVNGYHRLFIASQLGFTTLPARVIGPPT